MKMYCALKPAPSREDGPDHKVYFYFSDEDPTPPGFGSIQAQLDAIPEKWIQAGDLAFIRKIPPFRYEVWAGEAVV